MHSWPRGRKPPEGDPAKKPADVPGPNLVGVGASAGGITALRAFFHDIPADSGIAFFVATHLSPDYESNLAEVLQPHVRMPVLKVETRARIEPNHVYVMPTRYNLAVTDGWVDLSPVDSNIERRAAVDLLFRTIAEASENAIGVVLSGNGSDGVIGLRALRASGGITMAQSPEEAEFDGMPASAIAAGIVDVVLPARELGIRVVQLRPAKGMLSREPELTGREAADVRSVLSELQTRTGADFSGYKESTVLRRIARRMQVNQLTTAARYLEFLRQSPTEAEALKKDLLISVTRFFRDADEFRALADKVIPALFADRSPKDPVRVWVAGCATGEEAYSIGMLLLEHAGTLKAPPGIQIFASDLDEGAISFARRGLYPESIALDVGDERLNRFFEREGSFFRIRKELRILVLFTVHDLLRDPPFSRIDLITSRNLLIYLRKDLQERVIDLFHYSLRPGGYLFTGTSESVGTGSDLFRPVDSIHHIYQRKANGRAGIEWIPEAPPPILARRAGWPPRAERGSARGAVGDMALHLAALEAHAPPSILIDEGGTIVHISETANRYLNFPAGVPSASLFKALKPELWFELRMAWFQSRQKNEALMTEPVSLELDGRPRVVRMHVAPATVGEQPLTLIVFLESDAARLSSEAGAPETVSARYLSGVEAELNALRERLQDVMQEGETREEELKAANEELQSVNEEYKSTLEELETGTEELKSLNEVLETKITELAEANDDLQNLMAATDIGILFLDSNLRIHRFTPALSRIFSIRKSDEGRPLSDLTHRLDYQTLAQDCESVLHSLNPIEHETRDAGGRGYLVRITPYRMASGQVAGVVATFTDITRIRRTQEQLRERENELREMNRSLERQAAEIVSGEQRIRQQIARRLHDDLQQRIYSIQMKIAMLRRTPDADVSDIGQRIDEIENSLGEAIVEVRRLTIDLSPPVLTDEGLVEALGWLAGQMKEMHGLDVHIRSETEKRVDDVNLRELLFQTIRELLFNVVKHSGLKSATIDIRTEGDRIEIHVSDEGRGFPFESGLGPDHAHGFGLSSIRERLRLFGGSLRVESQAGRGTMVSISAPLDSSLKK